ncbi:hypothetical protein E2C01_077686 [Portunus trituberculatus]|uniref:Uncharacterized protein n=1 Tax=Portunus trituberculatus TaxID=210409 RepID=A0A5B7IMQ2_PORTR|nr:hypothetical protein [Portunus trituberculatus]
MKTSQQAAYPPRESHTATKNREGERWRTGGMSEEAGQWTVRQLPRESCATHQVSPSHRDKAHWTLGVVGVHGGGAEVVMSVVVVYLLQ